MTAATTSRPDANAARTSQRLEGRAEERRQSVLRSGWSLDSLLCPHIAREVDISCRKDHITNDHISNYLFFNETFCQCHLEFFILP